MACCPPGGDAAAVTSPATTPSTTLQRLRFWIAALMAVLVLVLATLAGRFLMLGDRVIETHGYIGNFVFLLAVANVGVTVAQRGSGADFALAVGIALFVFAQVGLGYVGRETAEAAAWHIPNGVLLMALTSVQVATTRRRSPAPVQP